jgi:hypothetical protein
MPGSTLLQRGLEVFSGGEQSSSVVFGLIAAFSPSVFELDDDPCEVNQPATQVSGIPKFTTS